MRVPLRMLESTANLPVIQEICETCKHSNGLVGYNGNCKTHVRCAKCKCASGVVSLVLSCPRMYFKNGVPNERWREIREVLKDGRS